MTEIVRAWRARYLDVLASVYLYNEHRGYTALDRVIAAVGQLCPDEPAFLAEIARHRADEHKHYHMFRRWFERRGKALAGARERWTDFWIHRQLLLGHLPALFLDPALPRLARWPHEGDGQAAPQAV